MKSIALKLFSNKTIERFKKKNMALGVNNKTTYVSDLFLYFLVLYFGKTSNLEGNSRCFTIEHERGSASI